MSAEDEKELQDKVNALSDKRKGGHDRVKLKSLFEDFDGNGDKMLNSGELQELLAEAGVGYPWTRGLWVKGIMEKLDKSPTDGSISWEEFLVARPELAAAAPPAPPKPTDYGPPPPASDASCDPASGICASKEAPSGGAEASSVAAPAGKAMLVGAGLWLLYKLFS